MDIWEPDAINIGKITDDEALPSHGCSNKLLADGDLGTSYALGRGSAVQLETPCHTTSTACNVKLAQCAGGGS